MSQTVRTNDLTNPSFETGTTGWAGTNCTLAQSTAQAFTRTHSLAITATTGAAFSVSTPTGTSGIPVTAGTSKAFQVQTRTAVTARTVTATILWYTAAGAANGTASGTGVTDATTGFTQATVIAVAPAGTAFYAVQAAYNTAAASEVHYIDACLAETSTVIGSYFDGASPNGGSTIYAWTSGADASTSTATTYVPVISLQPKTDSPCPRVEVTVTDMPPTDNTVTVWCTAQSVRRAVRGSRQLTINGSNAVTDFECPLNTTLAYDLEVTAGVATGAVAPTQTTTVTPPNDAAGRPTWWIQDPLVPASAMPLSVARRAGNPSLTASAVKALEYAADITIIPISGSEQPVAIGGQRLAAAGVDFSTFTDTAQQTTNLRNLLKQATVLLIRPPGTGREAGISGAFYAAIPKPVEQPVTVAFGGTLTRWTIQGTSVAAPLINIVVPIWTYGAVQTLWDTYQTAQTALAAKTYLDVYKSPTGT